jgi:hypothetical protein
MGVTKGIFRAYEEGRRAPSLPELELLAFHLKLPIEHFWGKASRSSEAPAQDAPDMSQLVELRQRKWNKAEYSKARGLYGRALGIVGLGQIGREIARRALAFGMQVVAWSRSLTQSEADELGIRYAKQTYTSFALVGKNLRDHRAIYRAIAERNAADAQRHMRQHLIDSRQHLIEALENKTAAPISRN